MILTSTGDGYVRGWTYTNNGYILASYADSQDEVIEHHFKGNPIYTMEWDGINEILYCGTKEGYLNNKNYSF